MGKARQRARGSSPSLQDVVDWLAENTLEGELDLTILSRWKGSPGSPRNRAAHAGTTELEQHCGSWLQPPYRALQHSSDPDGWQLGHGSSERGCNKGALSTSDRGRSMRRRGTVINGRDGKGGDPKPPLLEDAVGWYLKDESGRALDPETQSRREVWRDEPRNRKEYLSLKRMIRQMRRVPPPDQPSRAELIADLEQHIEGPD
jgi:ferric-dicitrate binding protein FerR (iron transport regulator)